MKIGLQLYQVDNRSYLLDFTSLASDEDEGHMTPRRNSGHLTPPRTIPGRKNSHTEMSAHYVMEFFEMCSDLIVALAC